MTKYKYLIELTHEYRQFEVVNDYQYPNEGEAILTEQYGGKDKCRVSYRGATEEPQPAKASAIERYKYLVELPKENRQFEVINDFKYPNEGEAALLAEYGGRENCRVSFRGSVTGIAASVGSGGSSQNRSSGTAQAGASEDDRKKNNPSGDSILLGLHAAVIAFQTGFRSSGLGGAISALASREAERAAKHQIWSNRTHKSLRDLAKKGINAKPPTSLAPETGGISAVSWIVISLILIGIIGGIYGLLNDNKPKLTNNVTPQVLTEKPVSQLMVMEIEGEIKIENNIGFIPHRSQATGDLRLFYFNLNTPIAQMILSTCPETSFCELTVKIKLTGSSLGNEVRIGNDDSSENYEIAVVDTIKKIQ